MAKMYPAGVKRLEYKSETWAVDLLLSTVVPAKPLIARVTTKAKVFPNRKSSVLGLVILTPTLIIEGL